MHKLRATLFQPVQGDAMNTYQANVLVHFDTTPDSDEMSELLGALGHLKGVGPVTASVKPHLLRVDYDPRSVKANTILRRARDRGHQACLLGF
jgi:hypothetical protein